MLYIFFNQEYYFLTPYIDEEWMMHISYIDTYLPGCNINNEELGSRLNFKPQLIEKLFGNYGRHFSTNLKTGENTASCTDLIHLMMQKLISLNDNGMRDIDFVLVSTATPDLLLPTSINEACSMIGFKNIETYQIIGGCSGAVQALKMADYMLKSGQHHKGLVIGVECSNKFLNLFDETKTKVEPKEMVNYCLFGDGVGGCIVSSERTSGSVYVKGIDYKYNGLQEKIGQLANWSGSRKDFDDGQPMLKEEYKLIECLVPKLTNETYTELKNKYSSKRDIRWFMPPQLSGRMVNNICNGMNIHESKILSLVHEIGNCANAALYFQLKEFFDLSDEGDEGIAISIESSRWLSSGLYLKKEY